MRFTATMLALAMAGCLLPGSAPAQVATSFILEGDELPGAPGNTITAFNNTGVNHNDGFSVTVNTSDGATTLSNVWGSFDGSAPTLIRSEALIGNYQQTSFESFFGMSNAGVAYSPLCTDTGTGTTGLDGVWFDDTVVAIEEQPYPNLPGHFWTFGSRPGATADGRPYWVGGFSDTQGGTTQQRGLFIDFTATPLLVTGDMVTGLPDPVSASTAVSFDYRVSAMGTHYIGEIQTDTGSTSTDNHMVIDDAVILIDGQPVSEASPVPAAAGGLPGENWDNFDYAGINESGDWFFTGDTDAATATDEIIVRNGMIIVREGDTVGGEVVGGAIEGAYMNEDGDLAYVWDISGGTLEALFFEDQLLLREGDMVDVTGDGIPDPNAILTDFTGISSLTISDRDGSGNVDIYFIADIDYTPPQPIATGGDEPLPLDPAGLEEIGLTAADVAGGEQSSGRDRVVVEGFFVMTVSTGLPPVCDVAPTELDFGPVLIGDFLDLDFTITNVGEGTLTGDVTEACDDFSIVAGAGPFALGANESVIVTVRYEPTMAGPASCTVELGNMLCTDVSCIGEGIAPTPLNWQIDPMPGPRPIRVVLAPPSPSPSSGHVQIGFGLPEAGDVKLELFDVAGRRVAELYDGPLAAGTYRLTWDGRSDDGRRTGQGAYIVRLTTGGATQVQKLVRVR